MEPGGASSLKAGKAAAARKAAAVTKRLYGPNGTKRGKQADRVKSVAQVVQRIEARREANRIAAANEQERFCDDR